MIHAAAIIKNGILLVGRCHPDIMHDNFPIVGKFGDEDIQGFIDDKGKFLTRHEAYLHAMECKQVKAEDIENEVLYSEDLWYNNE